MSYAAPGIILGATQPQITPPLQSLSQVLQMRDTASQIGLRQAQQQQYQAEAEKNQRQLNDQNTLRQMLSDPAHPEYATQLAKGDTSFLNGRVDPLYQNLIATNTQNLIDKRAQTDKAQLENYSAVLGEMGKTLAGIQAMPEERRLDAANQALAQLRNMPGADKLNLPGAVGPNDVTDEGLQQFAVHHNVESVMTQEALKRQSEQATAAEAASKGAQAQAEAGKAAAETQQINRKVAMYDQLKANPGGLGQYVAGSIDPHKYPQEYAAAMNEAQHATDLDKLNEVIQKHSQNIYELNKSIATVQAEAPTRIAEATAIAHANQQGMLGNQMTIAATKEAEESMKTFQQRQAVASQVQSVLNAANSGDPVSSAAAPQLIQGLVANVNAMKRQNPQFVDEMGPEAGSLFTRLEGSIKGGTTGVKLTSEQLQNLGNFNALMSQGAQQKHVNEISAVNQAYGPYLAKPFQPMQAKPAPITATNPNTHHKIKSEDNGKTWVDAQTGKPL